MLTLLARGWPPLLEVLQASHDDDWDQGCAAGRRACYWAAANTSDLGTDAKLGKS